MLVLTVIGLQVYGLNWDQFPLSNALCSSMAEIWSERSAYPQQQTNSSVGTTLGELLHNPSHTLGDPLRLGDIPFEGEGGGVPWGTTITWNKIKL